MKNIYQWLVGLICLWGFGACTRDLQLIPTSSITVSSFWKTPDDASGGLYGMYNTFRSQAASNLYFWGGSRSDELTDGLQAIPYASYYNNTLTPADAGPNWEGLYTVVHDCNLILKYVPGITFPNEADKKRILAQAYAMRAYVYFVMVRTWGDVPVKTKPTEGYDPATVYVSRSPVKDVFDFIKKDIDSSLALFPDNDFPGTRSEWSKPAVEAMKGDVYLWTGKMLGGGADDFKTALAALQEVQGADAALLPDYDDIFRYDNKGNKEILMSVHFADLESSGTIFSNMYIQPAQISANMDQRSKNLIGVGGGQNYAIPSVELRSQFTDDDQRRDATFVEAYTKSSPTDSIFYTAVVRKFRGIVENGARKFLDDVILYRYADVLLMIAEAKNALGMDPSAEINQVRQRAYGTHFPDHLFVSTTKVANDEAILKERLLELSFEGKRWWDLVRFGKAFDLVPSLKGREDKKYLLLFPISNATISQNPKIKQNPGYGF